MNSRQKFSSVGTSARRLDGVPDQRRDSDRNRRRSETPRSRDRLPQCPAYLGTESPIEPSLMMPGIINSFIFSEQSSLVLRTVPLQNQFAGLMEMLDDAANGLGIEVGS